MSDADVQVVDLPSHFSQVQLAGLKGVVDHHIENGHPVQFNASDLERIDGSAVQFLLAASTRLSTTDESGAVVINTLVINTNEVLAKALNDMGVSDLIKTDSNTNEVSEKQLSDE